MKKSSYTFLPPALVGICLLSYSCLLNYKRMQPAEVPSGIFSAIKSQLTQAEYHLLEELRYQELLEELIQKAYNESLEKVKRGQFEYRQDIPNFDRA